MSKYLIQLSSSNHLIYSSVSGLRMFKTDLPLMDCMRKIVKEEGWAFMYRGMTSNMTAVAIPIAITIFMTDVFISNKNKFS